VRSDVLRYLRVRFVVAVRPDGLRVPLDVKERYSKSGYVVLELPAATH
jgi:hypothetical protein